VVWIEVCFFELSAAISVAKRIVDSAANLSSIGEITKVSKGGPQETFLVFTCFRIVRGEVLLETAGMNNSQLGC
jgi:hypothetical protein